MTDAAPSSEPLIHVNATAEPQALPFVERIRGISTRLANHERILP